CPRRDPDVPDPHRRRYVLCRYSRWLGDACGGAAVRPAHRRPGTRIAARTHAGDGHASRRRAWPAGSEGRSPRHARGDEARARRARAGTGRRQRRARTGRRAGRRGSPARHRHARLRPRPRERARTGGRAMNFDLTPEQEQLRDAVAALGRRYGHRYFVAKAKAGEHTDELWAEAGKLGYLGVSIPSEFGGGGGGITELAIVCEELAAAGCPLLLLVVSPAIAGTIIARHGTPEQQQEFLPGLADGTTKIVFAITEPEAGPNFHRLATAARRDGGDWRRSGRTCVISGVDEAPHVLVAARTEDAATGKLRPALFIVPTDAAGLERSQIEMEIVSPENQFLLYFDDVRVP